MLIRHAAALALVGWYLMVPPLFKQGINSNAPLSDWDQKGAFDTADKCEEARSRLSDCGEVLNDARPGNAIDLCGAGFKPRSAYKDKSQADIVGQLAFQYMEARCVSTDDPRLKGN